MDLSSLKPAAGATKARKRVGRGTGSGLGNTSTRGTKGAKSRSGYSKKFGFEGGQNPLQRRLPKVGFNSPNRREYTIISLSDLAQLAEQKGLTEITPEELKAAGLIKKSATAPVKILANGELSRKLTVRAHAFSATAKEAIEKAGGVAEVLS